MTAAYLDPFSQIVGLEKPANQSAILIAEFGPGAFVETTPAPPPGYAFSVLGRWDGDVRIYLVPKMSSLSTAQLTRLLQGLLYYPYFVGQPDPPHGWIGNPASGAGAGTLSYFATQVEALEHSLMTGAGTVTRGPSVGPCAAVRETLEQPLGQTSLVKLSLTDRPYYEDINGQINGYTYSWYDDGFTVCTFSPTALDGIKSRTMFGSNGFAANAEDRSLIRASSYTEVPYVSGLANYPADIVTGTTDVPAAVSGQTQFNSQRAANLAYVGTVSYP